MDFLSQDMSHSREVQSSVAVGSTAQAVQEWEERIKSIQSKRATPEVLTRVREANERQRCAVSFKKKAQRLERTNMLNCAQSAMALQTFRRTPTVAAAAPAAYDAASKRATKFSKCINDSLSRSKAMRSAPAAVEATAGALCESDGDDDLFELENAMRSEQCVLDSEAGDVDCITSTVIRGAFDYGSMDAAQQAHATTAMTTELQTLLQQLSIEPTNDAEISAKFLLFETFLANVVAIREETISFWDSCKDQFTEAMKHSCAREMKGIDSSDAMGIMDDPSKWFVYSMTKKASENSTTISHILSGFRSRLELLSQDIGECPYCLEQMQLEKSTLLGCCHRVCTDCWDHWVQLKGDSAFCPLCRHEEFIEEVLCESQDPLFS